MRTTPLSIWSKQPWSTTHSTLRLPRWSQQRLISRIAPSARVVRTANEVGDPLNEPPPPVESHTTFSRAGQFPKSRNPRWPGRRRLFLRGATRRQSCDERRALLPACRGEEGEGLRRAQKRPVTRLIGPPSRDGRNAVNRRYERGTLRAPRATPGAPGGGSSAARGGRAIAAGTAEENARIALQRVRLLRFAPRSSRSPSAR